jgi:hypothetical protein
MRNLPAGALLLASSLAACGGEANGSGREADASGGQSAPAAAAQGGNKDACRLLSIPEVEALVEEKVGSASLDESMPMYAKCQWKDTNGVYLFGIEVWWAGGKQQWDIWGQAVQQGGAMLEKAEGVPLDSVVTQGPVPGIGDGAIFGDVMPSRVLDGDRFIEMNFVMVPNAAAKFRRLAQSLLARM